MHVDKPFLDRPRSKFELRKIVQEVLGEWDITGYFVMLQEHGATIYPNQHIIGVGEEELRWAEPAVVSSILHEIGHIYLGHYLGEHDDCLLNHIDEYEADEFAFDAVKTRYGYVPTSAGLWMLASHSGWLWHHDTWGHPSYQHRWERLALNGLVPADFHKEIQALGLEKVERV